jgi:hypothetical protein
MAKELLDQILELIKNNNDVSGHFICLMDKPTEEQKLINFNVSASSDTEDLYNFLVEFLTDESNAELCTALMMELTTRFYKNLIRRFEELNNPNNPINEFVKAVKL